MKFEFIYENNLLNGEICWYTKKDGEYVSDSYSFDEEAAVKKFELIVKGETIKTEVVKTIEI
jgi:hypothetical protein